MAVFKITTSTKMLNELYRYNEYSRLTDDVYSKDIICEIPILSNVQSYSITPALRYALPSNLNDHYATGEEAGSLSLISKYEYVMQTSNEQYNAL